MRTVPLRGYKLKAEPSKMKHCQADPALSHKVASDGRKIWHPGISHTRFVAQTAANFTDF